MIDFHSPKDFQAGILSHLLRTSYEELKIDKNLDWNQFATVFDDFDAEVFSDELVANCTFITTENGIPIGLGSFDPRQKPAYGDIGHNCIIPSAGGKGYGQLQIAEILRRLRERKIQKARVSTGVDIFFAPARAMYEACGFQETRRFKHTEYPDGDMIEYELTL